MFIKARIVILFFILFLACTPFVKRGKILEPHIRVLISFEEDTFSLKGFFTLSQRDKKVEIRDKLVKVKDNKIFLKDSLLFDFALEPVTITPYPNTTLSFRDKTYRGHFKIVYDAVWKYKKPCLINILPLEEYLYSVVACEIGPIDEKNYESAKAQAVAARSYALFRMLQNQRKFYDIFASPLLDQAYEGKKRENSLTTKAVKETKGEVLMDSKRVFKAMFHANCGGILYSGKRDAKNYSFAQPPFCQNSKNFSWEKNWEIKGFIDSLKKIINYQKSKPLRIKKIKLERERKSQRVKKVRFYTNIGNFYIPGNKFRSLFGLKSTLFEIKFTGNKVKIIGYGYGHGKGMCQDGAMAMARKGYDYKEILSHYYPKKKIKKLY